MKNQSDSSARMEGNLLAAAQDYKGAFTSEQEQWTREQDEGNFVTMCMYSGERKYLFL